MDWLRLWHDMPTDPKWRTISRISGQKIGDVIAVFNFMMVCGSKAQERGALEGWDDDDTASALDLERHQVTAIYDAMQGRVLDGDKLSKWEKRQPKREDSSRERVTKFRELKRTVTDGNGQETQCNADVTQCNAPDKIRLDKIRLEDKKEEKSIRTSRGTRLPENWIMPSDWILWAKENFPEHAGEILLVAAAFKDYWIGVSGQKGLKLDWEATWRNWVRGTDWRKYPASKSVRRVFDGTAL